MREDEADFAVIVSNQIRHRFISWSNTLTFREMLRYDGIPYAKQDNTYLGLSVHEMLDNLVYETYRKVKMPAFSRFIVKIPQASPAENGDPLRKFGFDSAEDAWSKRKADGPGIEGLSWNNKIGNSKEGSLEIGVQRPRIARFGSDPIEIGGGKYYRATGWVKNSRETPIEEGSPFLRLDFYDKTDEKSLEQKGVSVNLSSRTWGEEEWQQVTVEGRAPLKTKYLTISFQKDKSFDYASYLDDVSLYEVEPPEETFPDIPYIDATLTTEYIYPKAIL
jgi:hypothetical protein